MDDKSRYVTIIPGLNHVGEVNIAQGTQVIDADGKLIDGVTRVELVAELNDVWRARIDCMANVMPVIAAGVDERDSNGDPVVQRGQQSLHDRLDRIIAKLPDDATAVITVGKSRIVRAMIHHPFISAACWTAVGAVVTLAIITSLVRG